MAWRLDLKALLFLFFLIAFVFLLYAPGLKGPFVLDDFHNLEPLGFQGGVTDVAKGGRFVFGNGSGPTGRPVSMASFLLDDFAWPSSANEFKKTNVILHLITGLTLFILIFRLFYLFGRSDKSNIFFISAFVSLVWLVHPLNVSTVLYVVQRMAILSTLFSLAALYVYLYLRTYRPRRSVGYVILLALFSLFFSLAIFSKENALLVILFILGFECYSARHRINLSKSKLAVLVICILTILGLLLIVTFDVWGKGYAQRDFNLWERLLSQVYAVGDYIFKVVFPVVSQMNLYNGEFENFPKIDLSFSAYIKGMITPLLLFVLFWLSVKKEDGYIFIWIGIFWFFVFHLMESTIIPLELYFEHRNYMPSIGLILALSCLGTRLNASFGVKMIVAASLVIFLSFQTGLLTRTWGSPGHLYLKWEMDEPKSVRAKLQYSHLLLQQGLPENAVEYIEDARVYKPKSLTLKIQKLYFSCIHEANRSVEEALDKLRTPNSFDLGTSDSLRMLIEGIQNGKLSKCADDEVNIPDIFSVVELSNFFGVHKNHTAQYFSLKSDYYAALGDLNSAVLALDAAIEVTPNSDLYYKSADALASAGLYDEAIERMEKALRIESAGLSASFSRHDELRMRLDQILMLKESAGAKD